MVQRVAATAGVDGVDIDATSTIGAWFARRAGTTERPYVPIRSIWLPVDGFAAGQSRHLVETLCARQPGSKLKLVLVVSSNATLRDLSRWFDGRSLREGPWHVAIGLPSSALKGGRPHLVQLGGIRRFAEEWDLAVAIDTSSRFDPTWEAEAAIARLGERLTVLRLTASAAARTAVGRDRVACRALHAAIDRTQRLDVAIAPERPVPFPVTPRAAANAVEHAGNYVVDRANFHARALREDISRIEGSPSSQNA
jgi:hypothetical protein